MEEMKVFKIIEVKEINTKDGKKFNTYKTVAKNGKKLDVRFRKDCKNIPTEPCEILVKVENCNVDSTRQYPILWVTNVEEITPLERKSNIEDYFD